MFGKANAIRRRVAENVVSCLSVYAVAALNIKPC
jgi:hypothetical protein